jgi:3-oxoadipate enol-lactonase
MFRVFVISLLALARCVLAGQHKGIYYESNGRGEAVVLLHGGQMDRRMWDFQAKALSSEFRMIRYDLRGFGRSIPIKNAYSHVDDLNDLLTHLKVRKATLVGLSLGGAVAVDFAISYPDRVGGLVLVCPGLGGFQFQDKANDLRAVVEAARDRKHEQAAELWLANPYMAVAMEQPSLRPLLRRWTLENAQCWINNPLLQRRMEPSAAQRLRDVTAPTLIIGGGRDVSDIQKIIQKLGAEIPNASVSLLPTCGHLVPLEAPAEFEKLLLNFLRRN